MVVIVNNHKKIYKILNLSPYYSNTIIGTIINLWYVFKILNIHYLKTMWLTSIVFT